MTTGSELRVLIVDDEPLARDFLRRTVEGMEHVRIVRECGGGEAAVAAIVTDRPDVVLLDIRMPEVSGFDVIDRVGPAHMPEVVFVTAHEEHTLEAFRVHALDYVVKPCEPARVVEALEHARARSRGGEVARLEERLKALLEELATRDGKGRRSHPVRLTVRDEGRAYFIAVEDIDWIETNDNSVVLHVGRQIHPLRVSLRALLEHLDPVQFPRIHRSAAVNLERVVEVRPWGGGDYLAVLADGRQLRVSRTYKDNLLGLVH